MGASPVDACANGGELHRSILAGSLVELLALMCDDQHLEEKG
jgi:hypothetical protein